MWGTAGDQVCLLHVAVAGLVRFPGLPPVLPGGAGSSVITSEEVVLSPKAFQELREYSCSLPTGTPIGKQWKCDDSKWKKPGPDPVWWMGEYVEHEDPERVGIKWRKIVHGCRREGCDLPTWDGTSGVHCGPHLFDVGEV